MKKVLKNDKGLTLIELLAVIVILGIIVAIAIPAIGNLISDTKDDAKVAEAIRIIDAAKLYVASEGVTSKTLDQDDLDPYLDNVDDDQYTVEVTNSGGEVTYTITNHPAVDIVGSGKEEDLIKYSSGS